MTDHIRLRRKVAFPAISRRALLRATALGSALGSALYAPAALATAQSAGFTHSVASGDPLQTSVTLWTRYVGPEEEAAWLQVEIAKDEEFINIVSRSAALASADTDFCAHARPDNLEPGEWYYFRFRAENGDMSPIGRTRTLPEGALENFRIGVFSCANATSGWFNAYAHAAARDDLDLLVHLGDYIYESKLDRSDALEGMADVRRLEPLHETVSLEDYRKRYASYRMDPALQELHRRFPIIVMWDDHETVNNSWQNGADNHDPATEGRWKDRMAAGVRVFHEWLPMRPIPYTRYELGNLATLFRLESRLVGRSEQLDLQAWIGSSDTDPVAAALAFRDGPLADPSRTMLGMEQESWLAEGLAESVSSGKKWQILAQQVIMGTTRTPADSSALLAPGTTVRPQDRQALQWAAQLATIDLSPHLDRWDGYPAARNRLLEAAQAATADLVVLSGDSHNAWAFDLEHEGAAIGVELAVQSVSSLGLEKRFDGNPQAIAASLVEASPRLAWCDTSQRGYMVLDILPDEISNEWIFVASRFARTAVESATKKLRVKNGSRKLTMIERADLI